MTADSRVQRIVEAMALKFQEQADWAGITIAGRVARVLAEQALAAALAVAEAEGLTLMRWPPDGDDVQACADEVNPYAATAEQYGLTVETVCDVIEAWKRRATLAGRVRV